MNGNYAINGVSRYRFVAKLPKSLDAASPHCFFWATPTQAFCCLADSRIRCGWIYHILGMNFALAPRVALSRKFD